MLIFGGYKTKAPRVINDEEILDEAEKPAINRSRTAARLKAVQAIYQMAMTGEPSDLVVEEFVKYRLPVIDESSTLGIPDFDLFRDLTLGTAREMEGLDALITNVLVDRWSSDRLESTLHAILRVGSYELRHHSLTPSAVVISEYVEITHAFYDGKAVGLVNGVLDAVSPKNS